MGPVKSLVLAAAAFAAAPCFACEVPDEGAGTTWRRAVSRVRNLAQTEAWAQSMARDRRLVQYVVSLDEPRRLGGRCWWPVEVRADGRTWKRFLVTPQGDAVRADRAPAPK